MKNFILSLNAVARLEKLNPKMKKDFDALTLSLLKNQVVELENNTVVGGGLTQRERDALIRGNKIEAIKFYRERTGYGLVDSKYYIEKMLDEDSVLKGQFHAAREPKKPVSAFGQVDNYDPNQDWNDRENDRY